MPVLHSSTFMAPATPQGSSALAVLRVCGPAVPELIRSALGKEPSPRMATFGCYRDLRKDLVDEIVSTFFPAASSPVGRDLWEISCHGNPLILSRLAADLVERGIRWADPGEFTKTAFLEGKMDLSQAEAVADLIRSRSEAGLRAASNQLRGALRGRVDGLRDRLYGLLAEVEAYLDFPDEDLPGEDQGRVSSVIMELVEDLMKLGGSSRHRRELLEGVRTLIVGAPNAGKSSLMNRLLNQDRVLVAEEPGTTRDFVREGLRLGPWYIQLIDTAGLRDQAGDLERRGMEKVRSLLDEVHFPLLVVDLTAPPPSLPPWFKERLTPTNTLLVENKLDLAGSAHAPPWLDLDLPRSRLSALTGQGWEAFLGRWTGILEEHFADLEDEPFVCNERHATIFSAAEGHLRQALDILREGDTLLAAAEIREATESLGEILGGFDQEAMLDQLFARFCIGK